MPVGAVALGLSMNRTCFESGDQNGWVQQRPSVMRVRLGAGVGDGATVGVRVGAAVAVSIGRLVGVAAGSVDATVVTAIGSGAVVGCAALGSHAANSSATIAIRTT